MNDWSLYTSNINYSGITVSLIHTFYLRVNLFNNVTFSCLLTFCVPGHFCLHYDILLHWPKCQSVVHVFENVSLYSTFICSQDHSK